jgi:hypothetical protein
MSQKKIMLALSKDEAIVFMNFLLRFRDQEKLSIEDEEDSQILWDLCCLLEDQLVPELLDPNWSLLVGKAQEIVRKEDW